jgi:beta-galactosidase
VGDDASYVTLINHGDADVVAPADGTELVTGSACTGAVRVPAGEVRVVRQR